MAETLGVSRESLAEALETEGRIAVPTGEWTAKVAGTEAGRALLGDLTFESDGMTLREAQVAERELTELMRREAEAAEEAFKADELLNQELESVRTDFLTQATGAGLDAETAQADAEVWAAFARTAHRRFGIRPREFSDMVGLEIRQGREVAAGEGYSQVDAKILDGRYFAAVEAGDMEAAQAVVDEAARAAGYGSGEDYRMQHRAPNREDYRLAGIREADLVPGDFWTHPEWYQGGSEEQEAFRAVLAALERDEARRSRGRTPGLTALTVYRAVPKGVKEGSFRNGDWVTPSRAYAELEGAGIRGGFRIIEKRVPLKDLWWDGNSIAELGYDDGESYVYRDTRNNRKLSGPVVRDMEGNVVPPSRRFKPRKAETFYQNDAEARLSRDVASWSETVDRVLAQKVPSRQQIPVMTTPLVFNLVGADVLPVVMDADKVSRILKEHSGMGIEQIKQVPAALADPIAIFESTRTKESGNRSLVAMLEMKDKNMATVLVPLHLDVRVQGDRREVVVNRLASVYGKERDGVPNDGWFQRQVDAGRLLYLNEKKSFAWGRSSGPLVTATADGTPQATLSKKRIKTESDLVKRRAAMPGYYQQARGQAAFPSGQSIVTLFETADRSTLLHEMGHVFLNGLGLMAQRNEAAATEWAVVMDFLGVDDWDALTPEERTEAHETFARTFEAYLMEGKAPSTALQRAFRMFKGWLIDIYRDLMGLSRQAGRDVALSDEARDIFSRLLATDEEIAEAEALAPFLAAVEATDESRELHREATAQAAEEAGRIRSAAETRARRKDVAAQVRQELEASRGYRALFAMQRSADKGGRKINEGEFIERYGEMAWSESARPLGITSKRSTWALDDLALSLGYLTADEMVEEVLALPPLKDALAAQVDLVLAQEAQQKALSAEAALRNDARLEALILEHDSLAGDGPDIPRNDADAPAWAQLLEEVEAEEQNPLSRENLLAEIRERGGIRYESIKALWGPGEAKTLRERLGPGPFRKGGRGFDQIVDELRADGVPVESTQVLYEILIGEGGPQRQDLDVAVDAESLPWLVWMLGRDETRDYLGKRRRTVRKALMEATEAFEADRSDEARQARVAAQTELDYIEAALTELAKDIDPDARYRVDFDPATLGQPREGRATWSQPTVREVLAEQMKGTDPVKMRDAWALASRIARSAVGESRRQAREAQKALKEQIREAARARQDFQAQQRATVRVRVEAARTSARKVLENRKASEVNPREFIRAEREAARNVERALKDNNFDEAARQKDIEIINAALAYEAGRTKLEVGKIRAYLDKVAKRRKPGTLGADYLDRIHAVLEGVDFKKTRSRKAERELAGFLEWKKEQESLGEVVSVPDRLVEKMGRVRFDSLTVDELRELHDAVRVRTGLEKRGKTLRRGGQKLPRPRGKTILEYLQPITLIRLGDQSRVGNSGEDADAIIEALGFDWSLYTQGDCENRFIRSKSSSGST